MYEYEVTMMLNSLLGILVVLKERTKLLNKVDISFLDYDGTTKDFSGICVTQYLMAIL